RPGRYRHRLTWAGTGVLAGVAGWLFTGWPLLVLAVPVAFLGLPLLLGGARQARERIARLEAVEEWVRTLAGRLAAGIGLEQALAAGAQGAPERIAPEVGRLAARLRQGQHAEAALLRLADELASATGDQVVAQLLLACRRRGPGTAEVLRELADWVAEDVTRLREVEAERARPRFTARAVTVIAVGAFAFMATVGDYMAPYATLHGQTVLAVLLSVFAAALVWMRRITTAEPDHRLFDPQEAPRC
ncbi:type II secretion system F family protein, partial [Thermobifida halotolerans]|uniref:type II secretion system F family protein n=1 Tax=Thermobifida halotolerans TaxID=483545 RepID=UPI002D21E2C5